mmetsp:Transcript_20581/g.48503  ORF Transcript_20581/g.48503 Transcript_20581/m.48503 type:complete len:217 (+) Transcript_20581:930-1580(+)
MVPSSFFFPGAVTKTTPSTVGGASAPSSSSMSSSPPPRSERPRGWSSGAPFGSSPRSRAASMVVHAQAAPAPSPTKTALSLSAPSNDDDDEEAQQIFRRNRSNPLVRSRCLVRKALPPPRVPVSHRTVGIRIGCESSSSVVVEVDENRSSRETGFQSSRTKTSGGPSSGPRASSIRSSREASSSSSRSRSSRVVRTARVLDSWSVRSKSLSKSARK